ncbi:MAG: hypothetical protein OXI88_10705 [Gammaproteobacteria bacterium]|nr:hypothetical protein [Gammaproteobacteria bacterium]
MQTRVYVDRFNLYYGALKGAQFKGLNLVDLVRHVLPTSHTIDKLIYFTAWVSGVSNRRAPGRQQVCLNLLKSDERFRIMVCKALMIIYTVEFSYASFNN